MHALRQKHRHRVNSVASVANRQILGPPQAVLAATVYAVKKAHRAEGNFQVRVFGLTYYLYCDACRNAVRHYGRSCSKVNRRHQLLYQSKETWTIRGAVVGISRVAHGIKKITRGVVGLCKRCVAID